MTIYHDELLHLGQQNGLALYATWCMFVASFNVVVAMMYNDLYKVDEDTATEVAISIIGMFMIGFFVLDITCLDKYTRHTATPYILFIIVMSACFFRQDDWVSDDVNFILLAMLLTLSFLLCMAKSACVLCRVIRPATFGTMDVTNGTFQYTNPEDEARYLMK
ncbi:hypothetical protein PoB_001435400 [Plakobranchus ocellatus]|uniref:Uncharacterized protein n=1 Tax=Plakobranchus ocellatus TaxID=259542 RepID=A0AAV3Z1C9_9GAST|nr:hypothetical protein PoB_001435400 [Plakobranchus ocellatus]